MTRFEFMTKLQGLLQDISLEERTAAINYYEDYFEDAGIENVDKIIEELGSPERVAAIIKSDLGDNFGKDYDELEYTENGCKNTKIEADKFEVVNSTQSQNTKKEEEKQSKEKYFEEQRKQNSTYEKDVKRNSYENNRRSDNSSKTLLIILLCIFGVPVLLPIVTGLGGVLIGVAAALLGVFAAFGISAIACLIAGFAVFIIGLVSAFQMPINSMFLCGSGLLSIGIGILFMILTVLMWGKWIPAFVKGVIYLCKLPFKKRREYV